MKSFQLSFALILSILFFGNTNNTIQAQSPTTAPSTEHIKKEAKAKMMEAEAKVKAESENHSKVKNSDQSPSDNLNGIGRLEREVLERGIPENSNYEGTVVVNLCINRAGEIIYAKYNEQKSTLTQKEAVSDALSAMKKTKFRSDNSAHLKECGQWTFTYKNGTVKSGM